MRSILALSLLVNLCASANAATVHHAHRRHPIPNQGMIASDPASGFCLCATWAADPLPGRTVQ